MGLYNLAIQQVSHWTQCLESLVTATSSCSLESLVFLSRLV